jgi:hypothetical protein
MVSHFIPGVRASVIFVRDIVLEQRGILLHLLKLKLRGLSPHANYADRATACLSSKLGPTFADRG